jgi:hypothetical protein
MELTDVIIPSGTFLYRAADKICVYKPDNIKCTRRQCSNTLRNGIYFGNYLLIALGLSTELHRDLELGVFVTTKEIKVIKGKYSYRNIHPERFAAFYQGEGPHPNTLLSDENVGHFNNHVSTVLFDRNDPENYRLLNTIEDEGELFITSLKDLSNIKLIASYKINHANLRSYTSALNDSEIEKYNINFYIRQGILKQFYCNRKKINRLHGGRKYTRKYKMAALI